jgi:hypothetical protein
MVVSPPTAQASLKRGLENRYFLTRLVSDTPYPGL